MKRIGVNAIFLEPGMGGLETYVREMVPRLAERSGGAEVVVYCNPHGLAVLGDTGGAIIIEAPRMGRRGVRAVSESFVLGPVARRRCDVLLSPAFTAPLVLGPPGVVQVPDLIWKEVSDLGDGSSLTAHLLGTFAPLAARRAARVIAFTDHGAMKIVEHFQVPKAKIDVIGLGYDARVPVEPSSCDDVRLRLGLSNGPIVLNVAAKKAHKNLERLIDAMALVRRRHPDATLVLPGIHTGFEDVLRRRAADQGLGDAVRFPGYLPAADIEALYRMASCLAFPSYIEGFGLPLLEAMARDLPVVCASESAPAEVVADAALAVDPFSVSDLADAIGRLIDDRVLREILIARGRTRVLDFGWDKAVDATLASLGRAYRESRRFGVR
jgi:glycosyltransferase involved in cell wall biosynthesis